MYTLIRELTIHIPTLLFCRFGHKRKGSRFTRTAFARDNNTRRFQTMYPRINELRKEKGKTAIEVSTKIGIEQSYYSKIERGQQKITLQNLIKIADFYNVSLDYLIERTNKREINH